MPADLVTIATTAALTQFVGPMFKHLGEQALERAKQVASTAAAQLKAVGREPQPVEPKLLLPLVQAASLENDPSLADLWAALLANAADPKGTIHVEPAFVEILKQLNPLQVKVLDTLLVMIRPILGNYTNYPFLPYSHIVKRLPSGYQDRELDVARDNLIRLGLFNAQGSFDMTKASVDEELAKDRVGGALKMQSNGNHNVILTALGTAFLEACMPPEA
jgi:hypothetical protein